MNISDELIKIQNDRQQPHIAEETNRAISEALDNIEEDLQYLQDDEGYKRHTRDFLKGMRDADDVCSCNHPQCSPKQGNLPHAVRDSDDFKQDLGEYQTEHGNPTWITECNNAWKERRSYVKRVLEACKSAIRENNDSHIREVVDDE